MTSTSDSESDKSHPHRMAWRVGSMPDDNFDHDEETSTPLQSMQFADDEILARRLNMDEYNEADKDNIFMNRLTAVLKHYQENGFTPRQKKWGGRKYNTIALSCQTTQSALYNFCKVLLRNMPLFSQAGYQDSEGLT
ncbi:hypothetical protein ACOMHN_064785 [Nucella lapillus]